MPEFNESFDIAAIVNTIRSMIEELIAQLRKLISDIRLGNESGTPVDPQ